MSGSFHHINQLTDHLFRHQAGKMVAVLTRIFGLQHIELAEDVVQDTFARALKEWVFHLPDNPAGWLMRVARNRAIDLVRRQKHLQEFSAELTPLLKSEYTMETVVDRLFMDHEIEDSQLRMIFACCHPALGETEKIALTLKTCSGFSVEEIARALLSNTEAVKKRLQRARQFIADEQLQFNIPHKAELNQRLDSVLHVLYLLFNEGYNSSSKTELIRKEICEEALRLCLLVTENKYTAHPRAFSLVALMTLLVARFNARLDEAGEIILLQDQDRRLWNQELLQIGRHYLNLSAAGDELSEYHIEAAIVAEHSFAVAYDQTNWPQIFSFYNLLIKVNPSPVVLLSRAIVIGKIEGTASGLSALLAISEIDKLKEKHYLFAATLGQLYSQLPGEEEKAAYYFHKAIGLTSSAAEKQLLKKKLDALSQIGD